MSDIIRRLFIVLDFVYFTIIIVFFSTNTFELLNIFKDFTEYFDYDHVYRPLYSELESQVSDLYFTFINFFYSIIWNWEFSQFIILVLSPFLFYGIYSVSIPLKYIIFGKILPFPWSILRFNDLDKYRKIDHYSKMIFYGYYLILGTYVMTVILDFIKNIIRSFR